MSYGSKIRGEMQETTSGVAEESGTQKKHADGETPFDFEDGADRNNVQYHERGGFVLWLTFHRVFSSTLSHPDKYPPQTHIFTSQFKIFHLPSIRSSSFISPFQPCLQPWARRSSAKVTLFILYSHKLISIVFFFFFSLFLLHYVFCCN